LPIGKINEKRFVVKYPRGQLSAAFARSQKRLGQDVEHVGASAEPTRDRD
jgi:hypothetical protein